MKIPTVKYPSSITDFLSEIDTQIQPDNSQELQNYFYYIYFVEKYLMSTNISSEQRQKQLVEFFSKKVDKPNTKEPSISSKLLDKLSEKPSK